MRKIEIIIKVIILQLILCTSLSAATYYVAPWGDNGNSGTLENPFVTIQKAASEMMPGDTCYLREGHYNETLVLKNLHGLPGQSLVFSGYKDEKVVLDGTEVINTKWTAHKGHIYKTKMDRDVWQLFVGEKAMISARWPNARWEDGSMFRQTTSWAHQNEGSEYGVMINDPAYQDLVSTNRDFTGAIAILNIGSWATYTSPVTRHENGSNKFEYNANVEKRLENPVFWKSYLKQGWFFLEASLSCLDTAGEWYYNKDTKFLYLWPEGDQDPNDLKVKGKNIIYSPYFIQSGHIHFKNIDFFGVTFNIEDSILYFYPPAGMNPNKGTILAKAIDYCIYQEQAVSDVTIDGIDFLGGSVKFEAMGNKDISFKNAYFTYTGGELLFIDRVESKETDKPIEVAGSNITFERCLFAGAQNTALRLAGSEITVQNCVFLENNRNATFEGRALGLDATGSYKITGNTFFNNCSDAVRVIINQRNYKESVKPDVSYNNIFNAGIYNSDVSGIYLPIGSQKYTEVHHNWMHNVKRN